MSRPRPVRGPPRRLATCRCGVDRCRGSGVRSSSRVRSQRWPCSSATPRGSQKETFSNEPAVDVTKPQKNMKVPAEVRAVAQRFIKTAVARRNLDSAYDIVGPSIKQGMTRAEWNSGDPRDPVSGRQARLRAVQGRLRPLGDVLMEVALLTKDGRNQGPDVLHRHQEVRHRRQRPLARRQLGAERFCARPRRHLPRRQLSPQCVGRGLRVPNAG